MLGQKTFYRLKALTLLPRLLLTDQRGVMAQDRGVTVSGILRNDPWNRKVREVNDCLI